MTRTNGDKERQRRPLARPDRGEVESQRGTNLFQRESSINGDGINCKCDKERVGAALGLRTRNGTPHTPRALSLAHAHARASIDGDRAHPREFLTSFLLCIHTRRFGTPFIAGSSAASRTEKVSLDEKTRSTFFSFVVVFFVFCVLLFSSVSFSRSVGGLSRSRHSLATVSNYLILLS